MSSSGLLFTECISKTGTMLSALHKLFHLIPTTTTGALDYLSHRNVQFSSVQFSSVTQSCLTLCNLINAACQASLSITNSRSPHKPMAIESVMPSNHLICHPLLFPPSIFPSIRVFSEESALRIRWPKYWSFSFNISPSNEYSGLISFRMDWLDLKALSLMKQ